MSGRLRQNVSTDIRCLDNQDVACRLKGSVRNFQLSLSIKGGDAWAHLDRKQAGRLANFIQAAITEIDQRTANSQ